MTDNEIIPLVEDYDFSDWSLEKIEMELDITNEIRNQIDRMITENETQIAGGYDVIKRTKLLNILTFERSVRTDKINALIREKDRRVE